MSRLTDLIARAMRAWVPVGFRRVITAAITATARIDRPFRSRLGARVETEMSGLMDTFPAPEAQQVTLANWRTSPYSRWAFHHVSELIPTAEIAHDPTSVRALASALLSLAPV